MATKHTKHASRKAENPETATKRYQIFLDEDDAKKAKHLASADMRSFSNMVAWLINRELERRNKTA